MSKAPLSDFAPRVQPGHNPATTGPQARALTTTPLGQPVINYCLSNKRFWAKAGGMGKYRSRPFVRQTRFSLLSDPSNWSSNPLAQTPLNGPQNPLAGPQPLWLAFRPLQLALIPLRLSLRPFLLTLRPLRLGLRTLQLGLRTLQLGVRPLQ